MVYSTTKCLDHKKTKQKANNKKQKAEVTRRVEFRIIDSRVIRLQNKFEKPGMRHIGTIKVTSLEFEEVPSVQISI